MAACEALTEHHPGVQLIICDTCRMFVLNFHLECQVGSGQNLRNFLDSWEFLAFGAYMEGFTSKWLVDINTGCYLANVFGIPLRDWNLANLWNSPDRLETPFELIMGFTFGHRVMGLVNGTVHIPIVACCRWWQNIFTGTFPVPLCCISVLYHF